MVEALFSFALKWKSLFDDLYDTFVGKNNQNILRKKLSLPSNIF